jgi:DNA-binding transcriptional LysR family regulator
LSGKLVIGVVPTALPYVAGVAAGLRKAHPKLTLQIYSRSASEIAQGLEDGSVDAGITYLESARPSGSVSRHLFDEGYELLLPTSLAEGLTGSITWADAAAFPLCLLTRNMQNRRIVDDAFLAAKAEPNVVMETDALTVSLVQVGNGIAGTITPRLMVDTVGMSLDIVRLELTEPMVTKPVGVVIADREPMLPAIKALMNVLETPA